MGIILAKFRKTKTTYQILEKLEEDIKEAEALTISTREKQRRFIANLYLVSIGLFVIGCLLYYFYFLPPTWSKKIIYSAPLFVMLIIVVCLRRLGTWFFQKRLNKNSTKLTSLREEKKKIIERVMDTETYKVAVELLNRFGDKTNSLKPLPNPGAISPQTPVSSTFNRNLTQSTQRPIRPHSNVPLDRGNMSIASPSPRLAATPQNPNRTYVSPYTPIPNRTGYNQPQVQTVTPFPIINHNEKNMFDKILDFLMGDGLSSQYGMVCKECFGHNGMVSLEDYEYSAFRCAFCKVLNPAKKKRPIAPSLTIENIGSTTTAKSGSSTSSSDNDSGSENDKELRTPPQPSNNASGPCAAQQQSESDNDLVEEGGDAAGKSADVEMEDENEKLNSEIVDQKSANEKKND